MLENHTRPRRPAWRRLVALAAIAALALALSTLPPTAEAGKPQPTVTPPPSGPTVVTLGFDDGYADQYDARAILAAHGMQATFFVSSSLVGGDGRLTWAQLQDLYADGNEVGGHALTHANLKHLKSDALLREVCDDRVNLINQGFQPVSFAYPFGSYNSATQQALRTCGYNSGRTVCCGPDTIPPQDPYATGAMPSVKSSTTLADMQGWVTQTEQSGGGWVQIVLHHVCDNCDVYSISPATLSAFLDWLQPRAANGTVVKTTTQVVGGPVNPPAPPTP